MEHAIRRSPRHRESRIDSGLWLRRRRSAVAYRVSYRNAHPHGRRHALLALFQLHVVDCQALGRSAGEDCEETNGAIDGEFDAITVEDAGYRWSLATPRARDLLVALLAAGEPQVVAATHDLRTPAGAGGTYNVVVETDPVHLSGSRYGYGDGGATGKGFGLRVEAGDQGSIVEFSLLSETWQALQRLQWGDGNPYHDVIFPPDLNEKYPEVYE